MRPGEGSKYRFTWVKSHQVSGHWRRIDPLEGDEPGRKLGDMLTKVGALHMGFERLSHDGENFGRAMEGAVDRVGHLALRLGEVGLVAATAFAVHGVAGLNAELEQTQISLGAIFQAQGYFRTFEKGFDAAGEQVRKMYQDVKKLPGTFSELTNIMTMLATPAAQGGASIDQIRALAEKTMLTAAILRVPQDVAAREMANLLSGRAGAHNILGLRLGYIGEEAKKLNAESPDKRLASITANMERYQGAAARFGTSWVANITTAKDNALAFERTATKPLFDRANKALQEMNTWLDTHTDKVEYLEHLVGDRLGMAWDAIEGAIRRIGPYAEQFAEAILKMDPSALEHKLIGFAEKMALLKMGGMAITGGSSIVGMSMRAGAMGALGGAGEIAHRGAGRAGGEMAAVGGMIGGGLLGVMVAGIATEAALAIGSAVKAAVDPTSPYHRPALEIDKRMGETWSTFGERMKGLIPGIDNVSWSFDTLGFRITEVAGIMSDIITHPFGWHYKDRPVIENIPPAGVPTKTMHELGRGDLNIPLLPSREEWSDKWEDLMKREQVRARAAHQTNVAKIEIVVQGAGDPSRIARLTMEQLQKLHRHPKVSPSVPDWARGDVTSG